MELANNIVLENGILRMALIYIAFVNIAAFLLYGVDKKRARKRQWRISEKTLLGVAAMGGSLGALLGMYCFRHKTKHWRFRILLPLFLLLHTGILIWIFRM